jgi:hypothetical protein
MKNSFYYLEAKCKSIIWDSYANNFAGEEIEEEGFNHSSGVVYMALKNGVYICANAYSFSENAFYQIKDKREDFGFRRINELNNFLLNEL